MIYYLNFVITETINDALLLFVKLFIISVRIQNQGILTTQHVLE